MIALPFDSLLPEERPAIDLLWTKYDANELEYQRKYELDFVPHGLFSRLMIRLLHFTDRPLKYWRNGVLAVRYAPDSEQARSPERDRERERERERTRLGGAQLVEYSRYVRLIACVCVCAFPAPCSATDKALVTIEGKIITAATRGDGGAELLRVIIEIVDSLVNSWFHVKLTAVTVLLLLLLLSSVVAVARGRLLNWLSRSTRSRALIVSPIK